MLALRHLPTGLTTGALRAAAGLFLLPWRRLDCLESPVRLSRADLADREQHLAVEGYRQLAAAVTAYVPLLSTGGVAKLAPWTNAGLLLLPMYPAEELARCWVVVWFLRPAASIDGFPPCRSFVATRLRPFWPFLFSHCGMCHVFDLCLLTKHGMAFCACCITFIIVNCLNVPWRLVCWSGVLASIRIRATTPQAGRTFRVCAILPDADGAGGRE